MAKSSLRRCLVRSTFSTVSPRRLSFTRRAVFDLAHLMTLDDAPSLPLLVSERTKYLLNNLVIEDIQDPKRYAVDLLPEAYVPLNLFDDEYAAFLEIVEAAKVELADLMPTLEEWFAQFDKRAAPLTGKTLQKFGGAGGATSFVLATDAVPDGEMWRVTSVTSQLLGGTFATLYHVIYRAGPGIYDTIDGAVTPLTPVPFLFTNGSWLLGPGDTISAWWGNTSTTATAALRVSVEVLEPAF